MTQSAWVRLALDKLQELPPGWDGASALAPTEQALSSVVALLTDILRPTSVPPQFVPLTNGGVQIEWHAYSRSIVIEIAPDGSAHAMTSMFDGSKLQDGPIVNATARGALAEQLRALSDAVAHANPHWRDFFGTGT